MNYSRQRSIILDIVKAGTDHPTAEQIYELARKELPTIGVATVYRNLNMLAENGDIVRISQPGGVDRFDGRTGEHYHMRCSVCGGLTDLCPESPEALAELKEKVRTTFGLPEDRETCLSATLLTGVCDRCRLRAERRNKNNQSIRCRLNKGETNERS